MLSIPAVTTAKAVTTEIAIIGAGSAGCLIANLLDKAGIGCLLIEKSRGMGGRCSRRHISTDKKVSYAIDLGSPDISPEKVTNLFLKGMLDTWHAAGYLSQWVKSVSRFDRQSEARETVTTLCGAPSMNTWHSNIASHINILTQSKVCRLKRADGYWHLFDEKDHIIAVSKKIVVTAPPEQTRALLKTVDAVPNISLPGILPQESLPQYVCAIGFARPQNMDADVYQSGHISLHTAIRENSKPDRIYPPHLKEIWVLHSTHEWAQELCHMDSNPVAIKLADAFCKHFGIEDKPTVLTSHYWRMAKYKTTTPATAPFFWDEENNIGCSGDWLGGGGTVGALTSAITLHQAMLDSTQAMAE
jgi:renalase